MEDGYLIACWSGTGTERKQASNNLREGNVVQAQIYWEEQRQECSEVQRQNTFFLLFRSGWMIMNDISGAIR